MEKNMKELLQSLNALPEYRGLKQALEEGKKAVSLYGVSPVHKAHFAAALQKDTGRPVVMVSRDEESARRLAGDFSHLSGLPVSLLPGREYVFHNVEGASRDYEHQRLEALYTFSHGKHPVMAASIEGLMMACIPPKALEQAAISLELDGEVPLEQLEQALVAAGYTRCLSVEGSGQFSVRGGIVDIFPAGATLPVRAEFFGDTVDSLGEFDPQSQRRLQNVEKALILPARETLPQLYEGGKEALAQQLLKLAGHKNTAPALRKNLEQDAQRLQQEGLFPACDRYLPLIYPGLPTALDYLPENTLVILDDTPALREGGSGFAFRVSEDVASLLEQGCLIPSHCTFSLSFEQALARLESLGLVAMDSFLTSSGGLSPDAIFSLTAKQLPPYGGSLETALGDIRTYLSLGYQVCVLTGGPQRLQNMARLLAENNIPYTTDFSERDHVCLLEGSLSAGVEYPSISLAILCDGAILQRRRDGAPRKKASNRDRVKSFSDLTPGDYVVHEHHGIGRFVGVERIQSDGVTRDYLKIAFAGTDFLYVPATALDLVSKYIGAPEDANIRLSKLGGTSWAKTKVRAKKAARDLADQLIKLYAARRSTPGFAFLPDDDWQRSFEEAFPYEETEDQLTCTREIKKDMEQPHPMDRLLCGDVGFGKTEVAFRAIMKCVMSGKQAAVLVPTTVLARQHFLTALSRFSGYPIKIDTLSRFRTPKMQKETLRMLHSGEIDIVIGTHRMLQKDVHFKDLGLLVVDEEQRFGVSHKEQIKEMAHQVDVLTLTATPIPRTLNMALSGIRDMSVLEEAPHDRQPVQTYVLEYDQGVICDAIRKELARGGQVYYLHNRIDSMDKVVSFLQQQFPEATIGIAHGKMSEHELSSVMTRTYNGEVQILVCTTIIETGIDIANANTLVIEDADYMGLAQLHQIRGRIGRSHRRAYAYLTYRRGKVLSEISQKRLSAIREFAEFGSGFKIAMRDLEIRGAGNVLGAEQSGHMLSVGYDLYLKLLEEAVAEAGGQSRPAYTECSADLLVSASLPQNYVPDSGQRVDLYRRIALIRSRDDYDDMVDEMLDRYGDVPKQAMNLLEIALLRAHAGQCGISEINQRDGRLMFSFSPRDIAIAGILCSHPSFKGRMLLSAGAAPYLSLMMGKTQNPLEEAKKVVSSFFELYQEQNRDTIEKNSPTEDKK